MIFIKNCNPETSPRIALNSEHQTLQAQGLFGSCLTPALTSSSTMARDEGVSGNLAMRSREAGENCMGSRPKLARLSFGDGVPSCFASSMQTASRSVKSDKAPPPVKQPSYFLRHHD